MPRCGAKTKQVALRYQGQGIGEFLLMDALHRALAQSAEIAAAAVVVDAIDAGAAKFCKHFGFVTFPSIDGRLFLPMEAIAGFFYEVFAAATN